MRFVLPLLWALTGCGLLGSKGDGSETAAAEELLRAGDLAGAQAEYQKVIDADATSVDAAVGLSFLAYARGDWAEADKLLAAAEAAAGDKLPAIKLRRALVALKAADTDAVRTHAEASGLPAGKLLTAEVLLADGERDEAVKVLDGLAADTSEVGKTAQKYLSLLKDPDASVAGLAENYALWALGQRQVAVSSVEEVVKALPDTREDKPAELLLWAGRAASVGESQVALNLVESVGFPPAGQAWRVEATRAIIQCAEGDAATCQATFGSLAATAPADGLADARATAAIALGDRDPEATKALLEGVETSSAALAAHRAGKTGLAMKLAPEGLLRQFLSER